MIYSIQSYLENYFHRRGFEDVDNYAVNLARLYNHHRHRSSVQSFLTAMRRIRTVFYKQNATGQRPAFEKRLLGLLDSHFKKKAWFSSPRPLPRELRIRVTGA
jgi:hypothetical protein